MKTHQTLYEILEVPANARFNDIRAAFREIQTVYDKDSLSTYSLFSAKEREKNPGSGQKGLPYPV